MTQKRLGLMALAIVIALGIALRIAHVSDPKPLTPNERIYLYYAAQVHDHGIGEFQRLFAEYRNDPAMWAVAPPARFGYVLLLDVFMHSTGTTRAEAGSVLTVTASILTLLLIPWLGFRFFNLWVGALASALASVAFTEIWLVRGLPEDGVYGFLVLLTVWTSFEIMKSPRRYWLYPLFHLAAISAVLVKQTGLLAYGLCALWIAGWLLLRVRSWQLALQVAAGVVVSLSLIAGASVALAGDPQTAWHSWMASLISNAEAWDYNKECCFGPWTQMPHALFLLSPLMCVLFLSGAACLVLFRKWQILSPLETSCAGLCALLGLSFVIVFSLFEGMESVRYLTPGQGPACLVSGLGLWMLLDAARRRLRRPEFVALAALTAVGFGFSMYRDYQVFDRLEAKIPELGAAQIRSALAQPMNHE